MTILGTISGLLWITSAPLAGSVSRLTLFPITIHLPYAAHEPFDSLPFVLSCFWVDLALEKFQFALNFPPVFEPPQIERTCLDGRLHRAPRLCSVGAIGEPAARRKRLDFRKSLGDAFVCVPELQFAQPRRVHEQRAAW